MSTLVKKSQNTILLGYSFNTKTSNTSKVNDFQSIFFFVDNDFKI